MVWQVFKSEPSKCITHIDFDVVFPKSKVIDGAAESEDESSDGDRIVRLEDVCVISVQLQFCNLCRIGQLNVHMFFRLLLREQLLV